MERFDPAISRVAGRPVGTDGLPALTARVSALFLATGLFAMVGLVASHLGAGSTPRWMLPAGLLGLALLWVTAFRRGSVPMAAEPLEWGLLAVIGIAAGDPMRATGVFYMALYFRNLASSPGRALLRSAATFAAFAGADVVVHGSVHATDVDVMANLPGMLVSGLVASLLGAALRRQVEVDQSKDEFLSMVSHELRTPLTAVIGFADMLEHRWDQLSPSQRAEFFARLRTNVERQRAMVEDLLDTARMSTGRLRADPVPIPLSELIDDVVDDLDLRETVTVTVHPQLHALADQHHVRQILTNLLSNAHKYGAPPVEITASTDTAHAAIVVRDHGPGIPPAFHERLFERFTQASHGDRRTAQGFGLGLAIARNMARANYGDLQLAPPVPSGAAFTLTIPIAHHPTPATTRTAPAPPTAVPYAPTR